MNKILFENGTLVTPAKVVIDGVAYEVIPAIYSGDTPFNSENLIQMQNNIESAIDTLKIAVLKTVFPIGSTYITQTNTNPSTVLGFGTWERLKGRVCVGLDENEEYFNQIGKEGGETKHTMTVEELAEHTHDIQTSTPYISDGTGYFGITLYEGYAVNPSHVLNGATATTTGASQPFNITQPYRVTGYMWIRTE